MRILELLSCQVGLLGLQLLQLLLKLLQLGSCVVRLIEILETPKERLPLVVVGKPCTVVEMEHMLEELTK